LTADTLQSLTDRGDALKAAGRFAEAIEVYARAVAIAPRSAVAEHNLAAALGDMGRYAEAEAGCARAFAKGLDAPETWLVLARAQQGLRRFDEAEANYGQALRRRPAMADAQRELAQLVWMRTADVAKATRVLDQALAAHPHDAGLQLVKAKALEFSGDPAGGYGVLRAAADQGAGLLMEVMAADAAARTGQLEAAQRHAEAACRLDPHSPMAQSMLAQTWLAVGQADRALPVIEGLRRRLPNDQFTLALQATAWRLLDDPRRTELSDYANLVRGWRLDTPPGWPNLSAYLADLAAALVGEHAFMTHPFEQSLRHGSQAPNILNAAHPAIRAFPEAVSGPIQAHIDELGAGSDPVRRRNTGRWRFQGVWSVRLRPNGFHADHVHPDGWLSSACYIDLPAAVDGDGREGWIKFGEPGIPVQPPLPPEHYVQPEPGLLVLFPSYMWHGTAPFSGQDSRLTIAFDLVPT
jgi:tetratricopeptide (TPR) repeat protein